MKPKLEHIPHQVENDIHAFTYSHDHFDAPWHYHEDYELTYVVKGTGIRHLGTSVDDFAVGDLVLIGKEVPHCWRNEIGYNSGVISYCVQWKTKSIEDFIFTTEQLKPIQLLLNAANSGVKFTNLEYAKSVGNRLKKLQSLDAPKKVIELLYILLDLANADKKLLSLHNQRYQISEKSNTRIATILNFVDLNFQNKISITDMASITYMTGSAFCKYFKKEFKKSFTNYLNEYRVRKACLLLQDTDKKLLDIAMECGYENMSFFHRQFKKYLNMTPSEYRKHLYKSLQNEVN